MNNNNNIITLALITKKKIIKKFIYITYYLNFISFFLNNKNF